MFLLEWTWFVTVKEPMQSWLSSRWTKFVPKHHTPQKNGWCSRTPLKFNKKIIRKKQKKRWISNLLHGGMMVLFCYKLHGLLILLVVTWIIRHWFPAGWYVWSFYDWQKTSTCRLLSTSHFHGSSKYIKYLLKTWGYYQPSYHRNLCWHPKEKGLCLQGIISHQCPLLHLSSGL